MSYIFQENITSKQFDDFALSHPSGTFFQSSYWAKIKATWNPFYTGVFKGKKLVAVALVLKRKIVSKYTFMYVPRGPLLDFNDDNLLNFYLKELIALTKRNHGFSLTIDPYYFRDSYLMSQAMSNKVEFDYDDSLVAKFNKAGFKRKALGLEFSDSIQPRFQPTLYFSKQDISNSRGYKNGIKSQQYNVSVRQITSDEIATFTNLIEKTEEVKEISLRGSDYFKNLVEVFKDYSYVGIASLDLKTELSELTARKEDLEVRLLNKNMRQNRINEYNNQLNAVNKDLDFINEQIKNNGDSVDIAGILALRNNTKAELLYAGMDRNFHKYLPSNNVYVSAFNWAIKNNCESVCFGGSTGHYSDGVDRFKASFDPIVDEYIGEFIFVNKKFLNFMFDLALDVRKKIKKIFHK